MSLLMATVGKSRVHISEYKKGQCATCPSCLTGVIAKKGKIKVHHFAHKHIESCDTFKDAKTDWHILWQDIMRSDSIEVIINKNGTKHIADIVNEDNVVIEVQHSNINVVDIQSRESFYSDMIWLVDGNDVIRRDGSLTSVLSRIVGVQLDRGGECVVMRGTKQWWSLTTKPIYIDDGSKLYEIIHVLNRNYYMCKTITYEDFLLTYCGNLLNVSNAETLDILNRFHADKYSCDRKINNNPPEFIGELDIMYNVVNNEFNGVQCTRLAGNNNYLRRWGYEFDKSTRVWYHNNDPSRLANLNHGTARLEEDRKIEEERVRKLKIEEKRMIGINAIRAYQASLIRDAPKKRNAGKKKKKTISLVNGCYIIT
jgi:hypothetical protein